MTAPSSYPGICWSCRWRFKVGPNQVDGHCYMFEQQVVPVKTCAQYTAGEPRPATGRHYDRRPAA